MSLNPYTQNLRKGEEERSIRGWNRKTHKQNTINRDWRSTSFWGGRKASFGQC